MAARLPLSQIVQLSQALTVGTTGSSGSDLGSSRTMPAPGELDPSLSDVELETGPLMQSARKCRAEDSLVDLVPHVAQ